MTMPKTNNDFQQSGQTHRTLNELMPLINDTRSTGHGFYINLKSFTSKDVEVVAIKLTGDDRLTNGGGAKRKNEEKSEMDLDVLNKSRNRAKKSLRHKLLMLNADRLLTLTYRENKTDINEAWKDFARFHRLMKKKYPQRWAHACVPEYQKRGAVHFHLAISGFYNVNTVRKLWRKVVGDNNGNIDITSPKRIKKNSWNPKRLSRYLSKYISKADSVVFNRRRYSSSNIAKPDAVTGWVPLGLDIRRLMEKLIYKVSRRNSGLEYWQADSYFQIHFLTT